MYKKILALLVVLVLTFSFSIPAMAADIPSNNTVASSVAQPVVFTGTITVTNEGGKFQVGFTTFEFKKGFLDGDKLPATFDVKISCVNGIAGVEITPGSPEFNKPVMVKVNAYKGLLYDETSGENIQVNIKNQVIKAEHFSRYAFW